MISAIHLPPVCACVVCYVETFTFTSDSEHSTLNIALYTVKHTYR